MGKNKKNNKIKVIYRKLGREDAWGLAHTDDNLIEIDSRLRNKRLLQVLIHESAHLALDLTENQILKLEKVIGNVLWQEGYRKLDKK